jgi:hypothetical protein
LRVIAIDALNVVHTTQYQLLAVPIGAAHLPNCIAPEVTISSRSTSREPIWKRKIGYQWRRIAEGVGRRPSLPRNVDGS